MTVVVAGGPRPIAGLGEWMTVASPAAGQSWSVTVPTGEAWRLWGGGCRIQCSATVGTRLPGLLLRHGATTLFVYYNVQGGSAYGPGASGTEWVCYYEQAALQPRRYTTEPIPVGIRAIWLPPGTVISGPFDNIKPGDQVTQVGLLVERAVV